MFLVSKRRVFIENGTAYLYVNMWKRSSNNSMYDVAYKVFTQI